MARKVFFSFHYERDSVRVSQIRECNSISQHFTRSPFLDKASWESIKNSGKAAVKKWIDDNMSGTSVIVLCFGAETYSREWVIYELEKAHREKRGIIAINTSGMRNMNSQVDASGPNPLNYAYDESGKPLSSHSKYATYSWEYNDGRNNIDEWVNKAAESVDR